MNDIWTTKSPALSDPAGNDEERRSTVDARQAEWEFCFLFFCVHCRGRPAALSTVRPSAPGKVKLVYSRSSGDVVIHWTGVEGLSGDLCLFPLPCRLFGL